jgi:hypothetical protein
MGKQNVIIGVLIAGIGVFAAILIVLVASHPKP